MPTFLPFRALRPLKVKVSQFSAKSTDFKNQEEIIEDMMTNTESYYFVTKQNLLSNAKKPIEHFFSIGAEFLKTKIEEGFLKRDTKPAYYIYQQIDHHSGRIFTGIIGLVDVLDLEDGGIKKHELTKVVREEYLYKQLHFTGVLGEPVLMGHQHQPKIEEIIKVYTKAKPEYDFKTKDDKEHLIWLVNLSTDLEYLAEQYQNLPAFYIADGHHRCASTIRNYYRNPEPINRFFMVFLLDENQFYIDSFHRLLHGLTELQLEGLPEKLQENFEVQIFNSGELYKPLKHSEFGLLTREYSLILRLKKEPRSHNPEAHLDVSILEKKLFIPILDIHHPRTDHRLSYFAAKDSSNIIYDWLENGAVDMIISNFPITFDEVKRVADANKIMPPKSTYIEPKLRGGLIIQKY